MKRYFTQQLLTLFFFSCSFLIPFFVSAQVPDSTAAKDSLLLKQVEQQMQQGNVTTPEEPPTTQTRSTLSFNPDIGVVGDFQGSYISKGKRNFDTYLNE